MLALFNHIGIKDFALSLTDVLFHVTKEMAVTLLIPLIPTDQGRIVFHELHSVGKSLPINMVLNSRSSYDTGF